MDISFKEFLAWAQHPGIQTVVGVVTSIIAEYVPGFVKLERKLKLPVMLTVNVGVPVIAAAVSVALGYQLVDFEATFWPAVVAGVLAFVGGQANWARAEVVKLKMSVARFGMGSK